MPDDTKCTNQCQLHHDMKEVLEKHDKAIYGDSDKDGILTKVSSLLTVRVIVYGFISLVMTGFVAGLVAVVWKGAK